MLAGGEFGDHTAVLGMQLDLRGHQVGQHPAVLDDGATGFVARGLEAEHRDRGLGGGGFAGRRGHHSFGMLGTLEALASLPLRSL